MTTKIFNLTTRLIVMLFVVAPVAFTANLLQDLGITMTTWQYWLSVLPVALLCGLAWGSADIELEKRLNEYLEERDDD